MLQGRMGRCDQHCGARSGSSVGMNSVGRYAWDGRARRFFLVLRLFPGHSKVVARSRNRGGAPYRFRGGEVAQGIATIDERDVDDG